ncbi:zf-HC2 domain-containing protein [Undibacterium luofuense]|uniref:Zf-HC2 domain-containing protein n=1 Tax=Undibacterium luofuense TaxID=2828733 RepID=A0A941DLY5_9BURK|nr:zf-HC2 domain-containing protein [Undibacterium luofuense]MBR7782240.1 zf-HC2 domain-containing protein [Undibacterium luofuense]
MGLLLKCRETHQLVSEGMDRQLSLGERSQVRLHLAMCDACSRFEQQMHMLRDTLQQLPDHLQSGQRQDQP